MKLFMLIF